MSIQTPNFDTRVRIEQKSAAQDATYGTEAITWAHLATVWAEVMDVLPSRQQAEQTRAQLQVGTQRSRIRMRYRTDIDSTMRCIIGGVTHQIVSGPAEVGGRHRMIECIIEQYSTEGA